MDRLGRRAPTDAHGVIGLAETADRSSLMTKHVAARAKRDAAEIGSEEFRAAAEDIARIEVAIAKLEEPPPTKGSPPNTSR